MGRLFWKFFLFVWLAQSVAVLGVSLTIWLGERRDVHAASTIDLSPPAGFILDAAEVTLHTSGGKSATKTVGKESTRSGLCDR